MSVQTTSEKLWSRFTPRFLNRLGLRARFMVMAAFAISVFGLANLVVFDAVAAHVVNREVRERALTLSERLSVEASRLVLLEDHGNLHRLLADTRQEDALCDYAMVVLSTGQVFASTFDDGLPAGLAELGTSTDPVATTRIVSNRGERYLDVSAPMLDGELGVLRLGVRLDRVRSGAFQVRSVGAVMVATFLLLGLWGAYITAHLVAAPVERLAARVREFDPAAPASLPKPDSDDPDDEGEIADLVLSFEAMAQRLRDLHAEEQVFQSRIVRAERLATAGALAAGVAHDVNNPLAGIRNCLQAIDRAPEDVGQTRTYVPMMIEATHSIERAIRALMDFASRSAPIPEDVDLVRLAERTALLVRHRYHASACELRVEADESLDPIKTDPALLQQVLVNLLLNACDASGSGGEVRLLLRREADHVCLVVSDRGCGIDPRLVQSVFEPFVTTKERQGGTGLGLAMVKSIVAELEGEVRLETELDVGTSFFVTLPFHLAASPSEHAESPLGEAAE